jgi:L-lysine exporter family protein LysE/ArgO
MLDTAILIEGFIISIGLLVVVGPQNFYVLRQGLRHRHVFAVTTTCFLSDLLLISLGVLGVGAIIAANESLKFWLGWGGAAFLIWFALRSAKTAINPEPVSDDMIESSAGDAAGKGVGMAILHTLAFTYLNPWVYMDTMGIVGTYSVKYSTDAERIVFLVGAVFGSALWFYGLGYGAKKAAPLFKKQITWRVLDSIITVVMLSVAGLLINHQLSA